MECGAEYEKLRRIFQAAIDQAAHGKGKERHAENGEHFEDQQICEITRRVGIGFPLGQAIKKAIESCRLPGARGEAELLGAMNYLAAAAIVRGESDLDGGIEAYIDRHISWSAQTFGPGAKVVGLCKHIEKELQEIKADPTALFEWVDVIILALDGAWRAGYSAQQIWNGMQAKQKINFGREWPEHSPDDEPTEHIRVCASD